LTDVRESSLIRKQPRREPVALTDISRSGYDVTETKPVHRLQIRPIMHNYGALLPFR